jgi:hypothetical protein
MFVDVYGYPVGIFEPFSRDQVSQIRHKINDFFKREENKSVLKNVHWNANCLTTAPDGHGKGMIGEKAHDDEILSAVNRCMSEYQSKLGLSLDVSMYRCKRDDCKEGCPPDIWLNVYRKGDSQEAHWHHGEDTGCVFGFVYFVQYDPERDGRFMFLNPAPDLKVVGLEECPAFQREFAPSVREGSLMIFPAFMLHRVSEQENDERERITFAGNYYARYY